MTYTALRVFVFLFLVVFVAYVLSHAISIGVKKAQYYEYKKSEEYQMRVKNTVNEVKDRKYLKNIDFDFEFGLLPGQKETVMGIEIEYALYDFSKKTAYIKVSCPGGEEDTFHYLYRGTKTATSFGYYCDFGGVRTTLVGTVVISPAVSVVKDSSGEVRSEVPYMNFYLRVIEEPVASNYVKFQSELLPGQSAGVVVGQYNVTFYYDYIGVYNDVLLLNAKVKSQTGSTWSVTLYKLLTGKSYGFDSDFEATVSRILYLPGGEAMIFTGNVIGKKPKTVKIDFTIGITKET